MKPLIWISALLVSLGASVLAAEGEHQHEQQGGHEHHHAASVTIDGAWARSTPSMAGNGAAYMTIMNHSNEPDILLGLATPVAEKAELHGHFMEDGMMSMRPLAQQDFGSHTHTTLKPGAMHIMLMGLKEPLKEGEAFPLTLSFQHGGDVLTNVSIQGIAAMGLEGAHKDGDGDHDHNMEDHSGSMTDMGDNALVDEGIDELIELTISNRKVTLKNNTVRVTQGRKVQLRWVSDESTEIHVHGYDVKTSIEPGGVGITTIEAHAAGRFPITSHGFGGHEHDSHGSETTLLYLEVYPG